MSASSRSTGRTASIFISANELSGEMHAAHLAIALQQHRAQLGLPPARLYGNGSIRMAEAGVEIIDDVTHMGALGIVHIALKAPSSYRLLLRTAKRILEDRPDAVILVDSRVFHLRLAEMLRRRGYRGKIVYFVAPVRWESLYDPAEHVKSLSNPRFLKLKEYCDLALLIYPVSLKAYEQLNIPYAFIGHPECELAQQQLDDDEFSQLIGLDMSGPRLLVGALTGSRLTEVAWLAPAIFGGLALVRDALQEDPALPRLHIVSPVPHPDLQKPVLAAAAAAGLHDLTVISSEYNYDLMSRADLMVVKSGTGLHECVLAGAPAMACYRIPRYLAWLLRRVLKFGMPFYGLPNLLAGREVVPELIQEDCNELRIAEVAGDLLFDEQRRDRMRSEFARLRSQLCPAGEGTPLSRAASRIQELIGKH